MVQDRMLPSERFQVGPAVRHPEEWTRGQPLRQIDYGHSTIRQVDYGHQSQNTESRALSSERLEQIPHSHAPQREGRRNYPEVNDDNGRSIVVDFEPIITKPRALTPEPQPRVQPAAELPKPIVRESNEWVCELSDPDIEKRSLAIYEAVRRLTNRKSTTDKQLERRGGDVPDRQTLQAEKSGMMKRFVDELIVGRPPLTEPRRGVETIAPLSEIREFTVGRRSDETWNSGDLRRELSDGCRGSEIPGVFERSLQSASAGPHNGTVDRSRLLSQERTAVGSLNDDVYGRSVEHLSRHTHSVELHRPVFDGDGLHRTNRELVSNDLVRGLNTRGSAERNVVEHRDDSVRDRRGWDGPGLGDSSFNERFVQPSDQYSRVGQMSSNKLDGNSVSVKSLETSAKPVDVPIQKKRIHFLGKSQGPDEVVQRSTFGQSNYGEQMGPGGELTSEMADKTGIRKEPTNFSPAGSSISIPPVVVTNKDVVVPSRPTRPAWLDAVVSGLKTNSMHLKPKSNLESAGAELPQASPKVSRVPGAFDEAILWPWKGYDNLQQAEQSMFEESSQNQRYHTSRTGESHYSSPESANSVDPWGGNTHRQPPPNSAQWDGDGFPQPHNYFSPFTRTGGFGRPRFHSDFRGSNPGPMRMNHGHDMSRGGSARYGARPPLHGLAQIRQNYDDNMY